MLAAGCLGFAGFVGYSMAVVEDPEAETVEQMLLDRINDEREADGVAALDESDDLADTARAHSQDMHDREFYAHENPDGEEPWDRAGCNAAENIHRGEIGTMEIPGTGETYETIFDEDMAQFVADSWVGSESHNENMVDSQWGSIGVGVFIGDQEFFVTAMFC